MTSSLGTRVIGLILSTIVFAGAVAAAGAPVASLGSRHFVRSEWERAWSAQFQVRQLDVTDAAENVRSFYVSGELGPASATTGAAGNAHVRDFLRAIAPLVGVQDADRELVPSRDTKDEHGRRHVVVQQMLQGIPLRDSELAVHLRSDGSIYSCGGYTPVRSEDWAANAAMAMQQARIVEREARVAAESDALARSANANARVVRSIARKRIIANAPYIVWEVDVVVTGGRWSIDVDAISGKVIAARFTAQNDAPPGRANRDASNGEQPAPRSDTLPPNTEPEMVTLAAVPRQVMAAEGEEVGKAAVSSALPPVQSDGTTTLLSETFEGSFPSGSWIAFDNNGTSYGELFWDDSSYRPYTGSWSAWCADGGANRVGSGGTYPGNMDAWMIWGPFSLSDASAGSLTFRYWLNSELNFDYLHYFASTDGTNFYGYKTSGTTSGWATATLDFTNIQTLGNVTGRPNVWIAIRFTSDGTVGAEGAYVDNVVVQKQTSTAADLSLQSVDAPAGTFAPGSSFNVRNSTTNIGGTASAGYRISFYASANTTISTTDTLLAYYDRAALAAGANHTYDSQVTIPASLAPGPYYIGAIVTLADASSANNTNYDPTTITVGNAGAPSIGTGYGVLGNYLSHIDTVYDTSYLNEYLLRDVARRSGTNPHAHNGRMGSSASIETSVMSYGFTSVASDQNNVWDWSSDAAPADQHVATGKVYDYLNRQLSLNGIDAAGGSMLSTTDVDWLESAYCGSPNAFWDGERVNICDAVSGYLPYSGALDVVAHEWGHAVTELTPVGRTGPLTYTKESGALNEAFSDWMGNAAEHYYGETNWTLGEGILTLRSMATPRSYSQPDTYGGTYWKNTTSCTPVCDPRDSNYNDCCGVHTNSGVANKMFYLLSQGSAGETGGVFNGVAVSGVGVQTAMAIALDANRYHWPAGATFAMARAGMIDSAQAWGQSAVSSVSNAWAAVGVGAAPCTSYSLSPSSVSTNAAASSQPVTITGSPANCSGSWTAVSNSSFISATPPSGTNSGPVTVSWTQNGSTARSGSATIAGRTFTVSQTAAATCTSFTISPSSVSATSSAGNRAVNVTGAPAGCTGGSWSASSNNSWIAVSRTTGSGSGSVTVSWGENTLSSSRSGSARVAGYLFSVAQAGRSARRSATRGDFNNDGRTELLWRNTATGSLAMWEMNGRTLVNGAAFRTLSDANWKVLGFGDFNGDGFDDVFLRHATSGATMFWLMSGRTVTQLAGSPVADMNWQMHAIGDFNGDHKDELIWRNLATGAIAMWELNGATLVNGAIFSTVSDLTWQIQLAADFDGDGKDEILWRNTSSGALAMWDLQGRTLLNGSGFATLAGSQWQIAAVGDYNGDGKADLFWRDSSTGNTLMWEMNHRTILSSGNVVAVPSAWLAERSGDFTGDGKDEIIWRNISTGAVAMWELSGRTLINGATFYTVSDLNWKIVPRGGVRPLLNSQ